MRLDGPENEDVGLGVNFGPSHGTLVDPGKAIGHVSYWASYKNTGLEFIFFLKILYF